MSYLFKKSNLVSMIIITFILLFFVVLSRFDYLIFHFMIEFTTAIIGYMMLIIIVNTLNFNNNKMYVFLGIAYGIVGTIDLLHAIVFKGMNMVNVNSGNSATQLWIIARYIESVSLLLIFKFINKPSKYIKIIGIYFLALIYSIAIIFKGKLFPSCYIDGVGLTKFKIFSEYIICTILIIAMYYLKKNKSKYKFVKKEYTYLMCSIIFTIISEICFTLYVNVHEISNMLGHIFKFLSFYCIYVPLVRKNLKEPYNIVFNSVNKNLKLYKDFLEIIPMAILIRDKDSIVYVNNKTKELLKVNSENDLVGKSLFDIVDGEYKDIVKERIIMQDKEKIAPPIEEKFICSDGSVVDVQVSVTAIMIDDKEYFMGVLKDITHLNKLKIIENKLEEKNNYEIIRNEFFANISHEFRTPINVIYSALQLEEVYFDKGDYNNIKKNRKIIKQNCMRLLRLINNLIDITKIDAGFFKPVFKCNNLVDVIENIVLSVVNYVESRNMSIIFDTELEEEYVNCDSELIERIMLNLISNSIKYGKVGGCIYVNIYNDEEGVVSVSVKDDGVGIPRDKQEGVFERFVRVDKTLARKCEGSGIGLSLVKSLVEMQNGTIALKSEENLGTEIIIKFPLTEAEEEVCATTESGVEVENIIKKVDVEFSDIYEL